MAIAQIDPPKKRSAQYRTLLYTGNQLLQRSSITNADTRRLLVEHEMHPGMEELTSSGSCPARMMDRPNRVMPE